MHLDSKLTLAGHPILQIRDLFKKMDFLCQYSVAHQLKITETEAAQVLKNLEGENYITLTRGQWEKPMYEQLPPARSLAIARAVPPMARAKAEKLLEAFLERVKELNANEAMLWRVDNVWVFGSYLREEVAKLSDLDVAVKMTRKIKNQAEYEQAWQAYVDKAQENGHYFSTYVEMLGYPFTQALVFLRKRSRYLSLHLTDDPVLDVTETRLVFPAQPVQEKAVGQEIHEKMK